MSAEYVTRQRSAQAAAGAAVARHRDHVRRLADADAPEARYAYRAGYLDSVTERAIRSAYGQLAYLRRQHSEAVANLETDAAAAYGAGALAIIAILRAILPRPPMR